MSDFTPGQKVNVAKDFDREVAATIVFGPTWGSTYVIRFEEDYDDDRRAGSLHEAAGIMLIAREDWAPREAGLAFILQKYYDRVNAHKGRPTYLTQVDDDELRILLGGNFDKLPHHSHVGFPTHP